jgi:putative redox protein
MKITANWVDALAFDATSDNGHTVRMDTTVEGGSMDSGMSPKKMVLAGLCGCSGMDVVDILKKMKIDFTKVEVSAEAEQTDEHPKTFKFINLVYRADVAAEDVDKLQRAVTLSMDKYCGVSAMLAKHCPINHTVELI